MITIGIDVDNTLTNNPAPWKLSSQDAKDINISNYLLSVEERPGIEILNNYDRKHILVTARHEDYRNETQEWLKSKPVKYDKLVMRERRFTNGKFDLGEYINYKINACLDNNINYMIDDDEYVVSTLNKIGIISVQVNKEGRFDTSYFQLLKKIKKGN